MKLSAMTKDKRLITTTLKIPFPISVGVYECDFSPLVPGLVGYEGEVSDGSNISAP